MAYAAVDEHDEVGDGETWLAWFVGLHSMRHVNMSFSLTPGKMASDQLISPSGVVVLRGGGTAGDAR
eukprot:CAMPEP_0194031440 /NCGR_PEP_ID=MMETSP0009_2-20130614/4612_1 /TAXON_ID=210454 /ORGANISM="Grammatophora oceanica, Strain CCMP 410" /LENGTH=66 /DNA_ID=CAMNT_0038671587 /DNA_START=1509 /DNA_END=1709 /DNA_ORIENTATION=-